MHKLTHIKVGEIGEDAASKWLKSKGFFIKDRNVRYKWGEIDIVAEKTGKLFFIEVKSQKCTTWPKDTDRLRIEENVTTTKLKKLERAIQTYLAEKKWKGEWQLDVAVVWVNTALKTSRVQIIECVY